MTSRSRSLKDRWLFQHSVDIICCGATRTLVCLSNDDWEIAAAGVM